MNIFIFYFFFLQIETYLLSCETHHWKDKVMFLISSWSSVMRETTEASPRYAFPYAPSLIQPKQNSQSLMLPSLAFGQLPVGTATRVVMSETSWF